MIWCVFAQILRENIAVWSLSENKHFLMILFLGKAHSSGFFKRTNLVTNAPLITAIHILIT